MSQIILIENNPNLLELLSLNLSTYVGAEVIPRDSATDALELLKILPSVDLIITKDKIGSEPSAKMILDFIKESNSDSGLIILGEAPSGAAKLAVTIADGNDYDAVVKASAKLLGVTPESLSKQVRPDFIPVPVEFFLPLKTTCCDVFIRIKKDAAEFQFVKRIHSGDTFSKKAINKYIEQGLKEFYIPQEMQENFTNFVSDQLVTLLGDDSLDLDERIEATSAGYNIAAHEILNLGFTSATIQLTEAIVGSMVKTFEGSKEMSPLLNKIINAKTGYLYRHCHMTSVVASEILNNLGQGDQLNHEKLAYAAFFQDISLVDSEELAKIGSYEELEKSELSEEDWDLVFNHGLEASVLLSKHPEAPEGVSGIVKGHHGAANGKGYSYKNVGKLEFLTQVFLIANEFVRGLLIYKEKGGKPAPLVDNMYKNYDSPEITKIIKALEATLKRKIAKNK
ncbi:MAG: hypothetical protein HOM21_05315 [Halobacteriovoraceae bacterium]|jgi:HD-GYP domain-containing protein (c-di-GMP phosphodiesterase class II)|nr:hypothetical protein [Halobacteriovoraceae bacterium]